MTPTLESLSVEDLAALCGLKRNDEGQWTVGGRDCGTARFVATYDGNAWSTYADNAVNRLGTYNTEHAALLALARHLNLTPKEPPMETTRYTRIERDPKTDEYTDYQPREGDRWCFSRGEPWTVIKTADSLYVAPDVVAHVEDYHALTRKGLRSLTTHIERPVKTIIVDKAGYAPQVGDRFCGPEGVVLTVKAAGFGWTAFVGGPEMSYSDRVLNAFVALATKIERDA